jgi:hypothetical protein
MDTRPDIDFRATMGILGAAYGVKTRRVTGFPAAATPV